MKQFSIIAAALVAVFSVSALAESDAALQKECRGYAMEEGIPAEEMEDYVAQCVQDLKAAQSEGESEAQPSEGESQE